MFFTKLGSKIGAYKFKFSVENGSDGKMIVVMTPELKGKKAEEVAQKLVPIVITGTPEELDSPDFFKAIGSSIGKQITLAEQVEGYEKTVEILSKEVMKEAKKEANTAKPKTTKGKATNKKAETAKGEPKVEITAIQNEPVKASERVAPATMPSTETTESKVSQETQPAVEPKVEETLKEEMW